jgi:hypothetical protein
MELNVLVEAKKEYLGQLCTLMCPIMIVSFQNVYKEAEKMSKGKKILMQFQALLKEVPNWNDHIVKQNSEEITNTCSWFSDLLAAVFVSIVKILSSVRLKTENKKISIKLPTNELFIHTCYINAAKELYKNPYIYHDEMSEHERDLKLIEKFSVCIENTIRELIPIQQILQTYMNPTSDVIDMNQQPDEVVDAEDPDIDEGGPEPEPEPEPEPQPEPEQAPAPTPTEGAPVPAPEPEELKEIPVQAPPHHDDDDVLFPDASEGKQKPM